MPLPPFSYTCGYGSVCFFVLLQVTAMKRIGLLIGFFAILVILVPLTAQDVKKKDGDKADTKEVDKKGDKNSDDKKDPDKKKEEKKAPEKLVFGGQVRTKINGLKGDSNREYVIEVQEIDPVKVNNVAKWKAQREQQLAQELFNIMRIDPKDFQGRANATANYQRNLINFKVELAKQNVYTAKNHDIRAAEGARVRSMAPPIEFDDAGFQKKWTKKELEELRAREKSNLVLYQGEKRIGPLPGFPTDFDAIKQGQIVDVYFVRQAPAKKDDKKKKGPGDDDPPAGKAGASEFVLIVIQGDAK